MSLDVYLEGEPGQQDCRCSECGNEHKRSSAPQFYSNNITHNLNRMAEEAGLYRAMWRPDENGINKAHQLVETLREGLARLRSDPEHFKKFNPENGWGSYEGLVEFVQSYLAACVEFPDANVRTWR